MGGGDINVPPAQDSPKNIINILDDDCLQAVLLKLEDVYDFFRAAEVCTRFQNNAKQCFPFKSILFTHELGLDRWKSYDVVLHDDADKLLSLFGAKIQSIKCEFDRLKHIHDHFLNMMAIY